MLCPGENKVIMGRKNSKKEKNKEKRKQDAVLNFRLKNIILLIILLAIAASFFAHKILFINADIGRHIRNGELFVKERNLVSSNFYSYTEPDFPVVNHHWGSGVIFYFLWKMFGFGELSLLNITVYVLAFLLFFKAAENLSNFGYAFFFSVLSLPLFTSRTEVRPEAFSFLFMGFFFYMLCLFRENRISFRRLFILVPLELLWANLHLFFVGGLFLIGVFWFESLINERYRKCLGQYTILGLAALSVSFINPYGLKGFLEPFMIMREYGYMLAENQSVIFMQRRFPDNPLYYHFEAVFLILVISYIPLLLSKNRKEHLPYFLMMAFFCAISWRMIRNIPFLGFFFVPITSLNFYNIFKTYADRNSGRGTSDIMTNLFSFAHRPIVIIPLMSMLMLFYAARFYQSPLKKMVGLGLYPKVNLSGEFFKMNNIRGPIFNNYDIGSYLIFHLFPQERVFVDNRPEAYSVAFFKEIYEPMQRDEEKWKEADRKYGFNCIYFFRHDITPHAQPFLIRRIKDPAWAPVFVDPYTLILLKRNKKNEEIIRRYELPQSLFVISP